MEHYSISKVSKQFGVSTRTLRYYEQLGLIESQRESSSQYRVFDEKNLQKIGQVLFLRKLQIPLKEIGILLQSHSTSNAITVFEEKIKELQGDIIDLQLLKKALEDLLESVRESKNSKKLQLLTLEQAQGYLTSLKEVDKLKERRTTMEHLKKAKPPLGNLNTARLISLPAMSVASVRAFGLQPEEEAHKRMKQFIVASDLKTRKPDFRSFGFNSPSPTEIGKPYGYEIWVTVPNEMEIRFEGVEKKWMDGGLYAAMAIPFGDFFGWDVLLDWVENKSAYERRFTGDDSNMNGLLEEHLNYYEQLMNPEQEQIQLDLLLPIKKK